MNEQVDNGVWRFEVPGGWIYKVFNASLSGVVFVPNPVAVQEAVARESSRCAALAQAIGDDDAEPHCAREVAYRIAAAIDGMSKAERTTA